MDELKGERKVFAGTSSDNIIHYVLCCVGIGKTWQQVGYRARREDILEMLKRRWGCYWWKFSNQTIIRDILSGRGLAEDLSTRSRLPSPSILPAYIITCNRHLRSTFFIVFFLFFEQISRLSRHRYSIIQQKFRYNCTYIKLSEIYQVTHCVCGRLLVSLDDKTLTVSEILLYMTLKKQKNIMTEYTITK